MISRVLMEYYASCCQINFNFYLHTSRGHVNLFHRLPSPTYFSSRSNAPQPADRIEPQTGQKQTQKAEIYTTLQRRVSSELEVKRSKFVALAAPVLDEDAAHDFLSEVRDPRATHNCWAYKLGDHYRFNDDGEPGGMAGRPIHSAITSSGLDRVMVVVIRYFGGIKLGTGGLVRAYGGVTSDCLRDAPTSVVKSKIAMDLKVPFDLLGNIYPLLQSYRVEDLKHEYDIAGDGINHIRFLVEFDKVQILEQTIESSCSGRVCISRL
eukprot:Gb_03207 [translate_table: standard]